MGPAALDVQEVFLRSMHAASFAVWKEMEDNYRKTVAQTGLTMYGDWIEILLPSDLGLNSASHTPPTGVKVQILESDVKNNKRQVFS